MKREAVEFPDPPDAPEDFVDVGKECDVCGRNIGMFPVAPVCQYCRPVEQQNGDVITGIAYSPDGVGMFERVPNTYVTVQDSNIVNIEKGPHANCVWLNSGPEITASGAKVFFLNTGTFPPPTYWVKFK